VKPAITVDERGVLLHFTNAAGEGVAVPLNESLVGEARKAFATLLSPEGKRRVLRGLGRLALEVISDPEKDNGKKV